MTNDVEFCGTLVDDTPRGLLVNDGKEDIWLPRSQTRSMRPVDNNGNYIFIISRWIAKKKGIV